MTVSSASTPRRSSGMLLLLILAAMLALPLAAAPPPPSQQPLAAAPELPVPWSLRFEAHSSSHRAIEFLLAQQHDSGAWGATPPVTSLVALALANSEQNAAEPVRTAIANALDYIRAQVQADGSIVNQRSQPYPVYSTAISMLALIRMQHPQDEGLIHQARRYLLQTQVKNDGPLHGGFGSPGYVDLTTTQWVLEILYLTHDRARQTNAQLQAVYTAALQFIRRCQQLDPAAPPPPDYGGFTDLPSPATTMVKQHVQTPRGPAFLTVAGLKSLIYAGVEPQHDHVQAALQWIGRHYRVDENPGLANVGLLTYLYTMTKALHAYGQPDITLADGQRRNWRIDVIASLLQRQSGNGHWQQTDAAWAENCPQLATAYALLAMQLACGH